MKKRALIILADGFEDIEAISAIDILRRAEIELCVAGLESKKVRSSRDLYVLSDMPLKDYREATDALVLPGGLPGAKNLSESRLLHSIITALLAEQKLVAAICAAPALVLGSYLGGKRCTCYPGFESHLHKEAQFVEEAVVRDGHIITSRGPATAIDFALAIVSYLVGDEVATQISKDLLNIP